MHIIFIYISILVGIFLEGEIIMISSIIAAHHGYLNIWIVLIIGIVGTYFSDVFYFLIGKPRGARAARHSSRRRSCAGRVHGAEQGSGGQSVRPNTRRLRPSTRSAGGSHRTMRSRRQA